MITGFKQKNINTQFTKQEITKGQETKMFYLISNKEIQNKIPIFSQAILQRQKINTLPFTNYWCVTLHNF